MTSQLTLIDSPNDWRLDERTRQIGRAGIAKARAALREGRLRGAGVPKVPPSRSNDAAVRKARRSAA